LQFLPADFEIFAMKSSRLLKQSTSTRALFARTSRNSGRVILPLNDVALEQNSTAPPFYCVHPVSGVAGTDYLQLACRLNPSVRFFGIQAPLDKMSNPDFGDTLESLADYYTDALTEFQPTGPIMIGGYCLGAVVALAMARNLRARGREVGPLIAIDGAPENIRTDLTPGNVRYWLELARNVPGWVAHGDLARQGSLRSLLASLAKNATVICKGAMGLKRGEKWGGGYALDGMMDLSIYPPAHRLFINRIFAALFDYVPERYPGEAVVYEAKTTHLMYVPQIGRIWRQFAARTEVVKILGTHIGIMRAPYVDSMARDLLARILGFFSSSTDKGGDPNHAVASSAIALALASAEPKIVSSTESRS
jgi:thioesterase domain-containing protein